MIHNFFISFSTHTYRQIWSTVKFPIIISMIICPRCNVAFTVTACNDNMHFLSLYIYILATNIYGYTGHLCQYAWHENELMSFIRMPVRQELQQRKRVAELECCHFGARSINEWESACVIEFCMVGSLDARADTGSKQSIPLIYIGNDCPLCMLI